MAGELWNLDGWLQGGGGGGGGGTRLIQAGWDAASQALVLLMASLAGLHALSFYFPQTLSRASKRFAAGRRARGSTRGGLAPREEFPTSDGEVYLDHAGATLYSASQVAEFASELNRGAMGNPHSRSPSSVRSTEAIAQARRAILSHFRASENEYVVIFTSGATAACKLVGENFPWRGGRSRCVECTRQITLIPSYPHTLCALCHQNPTFYIRIPKPRPPDTNS